MKPNILYPKGQLTTEMRVQPRASRDQVAGFTGVTGEKK